MFLISSWSCLRSIHWSQVLSWEWRCSWSSADRRCSNYIWVINNCTAYEGATYIRGFTVYHITCVGRVSSRQNVMPPIINGHMRTSAPESVSRWWTVITFYWIPWDVFTHPCLHVYFWRHIPSKRKQIMWNTEYIYADIQCWLFVYRWIVWI